MPSDKVKTENTPSVEDILTPKGGMEGMDHSGHDMSKMKPSDRKPAEESTASEENRKPDDKPSNEHQQHGAQS